MGAYATILAAIDAQIAAGVEKPGTLEFDGRSIKYRDLRELLTLRKYYAKLEAGDTGLGGLGVRFFNTQQPGTQ